jgi:type IV pilus assembly protein PilA
MLHKLRERAGNEKGFTLIELLVVILIIGILAAIALPAFLNQRGKAQDTEAKTEARTAQTAMETLYTDEQDYTTGKTAGTLSNIEPALGASQNKSTLTVNAASKDAYNLTVTSQTGNAFTIDKASDGTVTRSCTAKGKFGCPQSGSW